MYMYLYDLIVCNHYNGIPDSFQKGFKFLLLGIGKRLFEHHQKLRAVRKRNFLVCLRFNAGVYLRYGSGFVRFFFGGGFIVDFFALHNQKRAAQHLD